MVSCCLFKEMTVALSISSHEIHLLWGGEAVFGGLLMWRQPKYTWTACHQLWWEHYYRGTLNRDTSHWVSVDRCCSADWVSTQKLHRLKFTRAEWWRLWRQDSFCILTALNRCNMWHFCDKMSHILLSCVSKMLKPSKFWNDAFNLVTCC